MYKYTHFFQKKFISCRNSPQIFVIIYKASHNFISEEMGSVVGKVNDVSLNRRFVETDDEEEARELLRLLFNAHYKNVLDIIDKRRWNHPDTVVDPDEITSATFLKAFNKRKQIGEPEKLFEWLVTAAKNLMIDKIRIARQKRRLAVETVGTFFHVEKKQPFATSLAETDAEQAEAEREQIAQLLCLLEGPDREIVVSMRDGLSQKAIAQNMDTTPGAVEKRWKRLKIWAAPILHHLEALIDCLPKKRDRNVMERYFLDVQPFSEITEALGISHATVEETVERVIADWKKAAKDNPTDPVSAMVKKER